MIPSRAPCRSKRGNIRDAGLTQGTKRGGSVWSISWFWYLYLSISFYRYLPISIYICRWRHELWKKNKSQCMVLHQCYRVYILLARHETYLRDQYHDHGPCPHKYVSYFIETKPKGGSMKAVISAILSLSLSIYIYIYISRRNIDGIHDSSHIHRYLSIYIYPSCLDLYRVSWVAHHETKKIYECDEISI